MSEQEEIGKLFLKDFIKTIVLEKSKNIRKNRLEIELVEQLKADAGIKRIPIKKTEILPKKSEYEKNIIRGYLSPSIHDIEKDNLKPNEKEKQLIQEIFSRNIQNIERKLGRNVQKGYNQQFPQNSTIKSQFQPKIIQQESNIPRPALPTLRTSSTEQINIIGLAKLDKLLEDNGIQTIECPGPGKQILVYKSGVIQTTNLTLTSEEINNIMKEIAEKTRIPLMSGVLKAAFGQFIVTSVMSEFVGTRFIIQRKARMPPQQFKQ